VPTFQPESGSAGGAAPGAVPERVQAAREAELPEAVATSGAAGGAGTGAARAPVQAARPWAPVQARGCSGRRRGRFRRFAERIDQADGGRGIELLFARQGSVVVPGGEAEADCQTAADVRREERVEVHAGPRAFDEALEIFDAGPERDLFVECVLEPDEEPSRVIGLGLGQRRHGRIGLQRVVTPDVVLKVVAELPQNAVGSVLTNKYFAPGSTLSRKFKPWNLS